MQTIYTVLEFKPHKYNTPQGDRLRRALLGNTNGNKLRYIHSAKWQQNLSGIMGWWVRLVFGIWEWLGIFDALDFVYRKFAKVRSLNSRELAEAISVYGTDLPYHNIKICENSSLARLLVARKDNLHLGMVISYTIHFSRSINCKIGNRDMAWLIHELVHIAQMHYSGSSYIAEALVAQYTEGYNYGGIAALQHKAFYQFNREQQGDIARDYYLLLHADNLPNRDQYINIYEPAIKDLRAGKL